MEKLLNAYIKRLSNIGSSNRALYLLKLYKDQFLDLHDLDFAYKQPSFHLIEQLLSGKTSIALCDELDSRDGSINELSAQLKKIIRREAYILEETGIRNCAVGWPFVEGKFTDGTLLRAPLLLFDVRIELVNRKWYLTRQQDTPIRFNKAFLLAFSFYNSISLTDDFIETTFEDFPKEALGFRTSLYEYLKNSPLELNFNQELFTNSLIPFKDYTSIEYSARYQKGTLKLFSQAVVGIFPKSSSHLVPDYETLLQQNEFSSLEEFLLSKKISLPKYKGKEEHSHYIFPINASQEEALYAVKEGNSIVVQGPPGTGKSQLICNLISDYTANGKKVLLVSQKKAALEVVYERLKNASIAPFLGLVHDYHQDRTYLFDQIAKQIQHVNDYIEATNSLDTINLERSFLHASRAITANAEVLDSFKKALYASSEFGISPKELYLSSSPNQPKCLLGAFATTMNFSEATAFEKKIALFLPYALVYDAKHYTWKNRKSFAGYQHQDKQLLLDVLNTISKTTLYILEEVRKTIQHPSYALDGLFFLSHATIINSLTEQVKEEITVDRLQKVISGKLTLDQLEKVKKKVLHQFNSPTPELSLLYSDLPEAKKITENYLNASDYWVTNLRWSLFSKEKKTLKNLSSSHGLSLSKKDCLFLLSKLDKRITLEKSCESVSKNSWAATFPKERNYDALEKWFDDTKKIIELRNLVIDYPILEELLFLPTIKPSTSLFYCNFLLEISTTLQLQYSKWLHYFTPKMVEEVISDPQSYVQLSLNLEKDFDHLVELDNQKNKYSSSELAIIEKLIEDSEGKTVSECCLLFNNSIRIHWLEKLEEKYPVLRLVSTFGLRQHEQALQEAIEEKQSLSGQLLLLKLMEKTFKNIAYNRLQNRVTYRDLLHQVTKKKSRWPVRKLIQTFSDELFNLIPCWMVSPESASALFPLTQHFDLVIFDEASQCFSEYGLSAMFRGKQVVIAGDSKQLRPTNLYQTRWEDAEENESIDLELESLLELTEHYLPTKYLTGHYRSKQFDLLDFSNQHFYNNSLSLIPNFSDINSYIPSIDYRLVEGYWENQVNPIEAKKVADTVLSLLSTSDNKSIGVITFNYKQAQLILDYLEPLALEAQLVLPKSLFVKNIENVQGDEKDIIIFSIGYAKDRQGRFTMQFGSLNQEGGENRLNVAITRAREKVILVASILPHQLEVENTLHEGPKLFKLYLDYAWNVSKGLYKPTPYSKTNPSPDWYLTSKIGSASQSLAYSVSEELPFADLTIKKQENYYAIIRTDDDLYFKARNSKEAHAYIPMELKKKGWKFMDIYSRAFWLNQLPPFEVVP